MKIAVVLPVYNGARYLEQNIVSVLNQSINNFDFIICDDNSTDSSLSIVKSLMEKYPNRIRLFENAINMGLFKTLNMLLNETNADFIHLWAQDDIMKENCLEKVLAFHIQHPEISMSYHQVNYVNEQNQLDRTKIEDNTPEIVNANLYAQICAYWGCIAGNIANVTLNRTALNVCGHFDENYVVSGDFELWTRLVNHKPIGYIKEPLIFLRKHSDQLSRKLTSIYYSMREDIPIQKQLMLMVNATDLKSVVCAWKWKTLVKYFNEITFLIYKGEIKLARRCFKLLANETNLFGLSLRWGIIRILRTLKMENWFYTKGLKTLKTSIN